MLIVWLTPAQLSAIVVGSHEDRWPAIYVSDAAVNH
jgi:hypothetical protein